jgi:hypothetical protein
MAGERRHQTGLILCYSKTNDEPTNVYSDGDDDDEDVIGTLPVLIVGGVVNP